MLAALKRYPRSVNLLFCATFVLTLGRAISLPFLVVYLSSAFALPIARIGAIVGGALIAGSVLSLYGGYLTDRLSSRGLILGYTACFIAGFVGMCLTANLWLFFGFLVAFNFAYSAVDVVVKASFGRLLPAQEQGRAFSIRYTFINIGYAVGPFLGAGLAHWAPKLPFVVSALLGAGFLLLYLGYGERSQRPAPAGQAPVSFLALGRVLLDDRRLVCFTLGGVLSAVVFGQFTAYLSQYLVTTRSAEVAYQVISTVVAVNALVVIALQYPLGRRIDENRLETWLLIGLALFLAGVIGFALSTSVLHWVLAMTVFTLGEIIVFPAEYMFIDRIAPPQLRGMYYGAQNLSNLGGALGPVLCGWVLASLPAHWMFVMLGAFVVAGGVFYRLGAALPALPRQP
ncbi:MULTISPECIES: MFS transporter [unclassified Pseudomonas]|uniref:MFS transporter n=1 Tax=unclassified Pseudomonas TaxID=196821 RepID=UPI000731ABDA|nr:MULTISPECIES: MFS transporter [unclassified Pseudomonas]KSW22153.1 MFS transporter [Pseudomonas sp. ADP]OBP10400.1 MFS transporter [Pseudomonas sp. EGD-AKN5]QOF84941.1 MFS transporter [Pseudomonas sp. ADPe]